ncbi:MAG: exodeoxyribonuclease VII small subunit [Bacteroidales bacterium]|nr:exodeoxyribonuclease VII small subunit [Bacteroidales bacterium]
MAKKNISYNDAVQEIEDILNEIENSDVEIDSLSDKVKRVSVLLETCKSKLLKTEEQIEKIFENNIS